MAEVPNLLDMFQNNRKDVRPALKPAAEAKAAQSLLPIDRASSAKSGTPFQAKVEKSKAKLAAKAHKFFAQNKPVAKPETSAKPVAKETAAPAVRADRSEAAQAPTRRDRTEAQSQAKAADRPGRAQAAKPGSAPEKGMDAESADAIQEGLAELGIEATEAQLNDPAFLLDMLRLLQSLPSAAALAGEPEGAIATDAIGAGATAETAQIALPLVDQDGNSEVTEEGIEIPADAALNSGKALSRSELSELIGGRAAGLAQAAAAEQGQVQVTAQAPTSTPKEWHGIQVRPQAEGPGTEPLPMADLDRLRVMQSAAMQAEGRSEASGSDLSIESDSSEPETIGEARATGGDAEAEGEQDAQADLFGRNGDRTGNADATARKEGPMVAKDGATGPQFSQSLDQARNVDPRAGIQRGADPRPAGPDAGVMEQIAKKMAASSVKHGDTISIQLSPEHLGKVSVSLEMKDGIMAARIAVESDAVKKQVEANLSSLKDALQNQGIQLQGLEVSVDQRHSNLFNPDGSNSESFFRRNGRGQGQGESGQAAETAFESAPEADTGRRWGFNTMEYIG